MRKAFGIGILALVLSIGGLIGMSLWLYDASDRVEITETVVEGDPSLAEGITMESRSMLDYRLFWDTAYRIGSEPAVDTRYHFSAEKEYKRVETPYRGIMLTSGISYGMGSTQREEAAGYDSTAGLETAYWELYDTLGPGEKGSRMVYLKDYYTYYPIGVIFDFPGQGRVRRMVSDPDPTYPGTYAYATWQLNEYFKIPVDERTQVEISLEIGNDGKIQGIGGGTEIFGLNLYTFSVLTEEACYFALTCEGDSVDYSQLPDGFGIYRLPYGEGTDRECKIKVDEMEMVYELNPEEKIAFFALDESQSRLRMIVRSGDEYRLRVIEIATMRLLQDIEVMDASERDYLYIHEEKGMLAVTADSGKLAYITENGAGEYATRWYVSIDTGEESILDYSVIKMQSDGDRLIVVWTPRSSENDFRVSIFDTSGRIFYGEYANSLSLSNYDYTNPIMTDLTRIGK